jgi:general secretion pathway protein G
MHEADRCYRPLLRQRGPEPETGLTILETLVVIAIMALLLGIVAPASLRLLAGARVKVAKQSIERLCSVLDIYKLDVGSYPTPADGLRALIDKPTYANNWNGPYLTNSDGLIDPWGNPYIYRSPSERNGHDYDICSRGPDAESTAAMICNP